MEAHCFGCKKKTLVKDAKIVDTSNKRRRLEGKCAACGRSVSNFVKSDVVVAAAAAAPIAEASPTPSSSVEVDTEVPQHKDSSPEREATA